MLTKRQFCCTILFRYLHTVQRLPLMLESYITQKTDEEDKKDITLVANFLPLSSIHTS